MPRRTPRDQSTATASTNAPRTATATPSTASLLVVHIAGPRLPRSFHVPWRTRHGPGRESAPRLVTLARRSHTPIAPASTRGGGQAVARSRRMSSGRRQQRVRVEVAQRGRALDHAAAGEDPFEAAVVGVVLRPPGAGPVEEVRGRRVAGRHDDLLRLAERAGVVG